MWGGTGAFPCNQRWTRWWTRFVCDWFHMNLLHDADTRVGGGVCLCLFVGRTPLRLFCTCGRSGTPRTPSAYMAQCTICISYAHYAGWLVCWFCLVRKQCSTLAASKQHALLACNTFHWCARGARWYCEHIGEESTQGTFEHQSMHGKFAFFCVLICRFYRWNWEKHREIERGTQWQYKTTDDLCFCIHSTWVSLRSFIHRQRLSILTVEKQCKSIKKNLIYSVISLQTMLVPNSWVSCPTFYFFHLLWPSDPSASIFVSMGQVAHYKLSQFVGLYSCWVKSFFQRPLW